MAAPICLHRGPAPLAARGGMHCPAWDGPGSRPSTRGVEGGPDDPFTDDVGSLWEQAIAAGAEEVFPLGDQFYGDRSGRVRDPCGHTWGLGQHIEDVSDEEMRRRMAAFYD